MVPKNPVSPEFFWSHVLVAAPDDCWEWTGHREVTGYGRIRLGAVRWRAHRAAYAYAHPAWDHQGMVCHSCDRPWCCNPAHLWLGTGLENALDMHSKGRGYRAKGEGNGHARLTDAAIADIRSSGLKQAELAAKYGVTQSLISMIRAVKRWRHL